jgi:hypothetical protein
LDILTYGDSFVNFEKHKASDSFFPTTLTVDGCVFSVSPCFFFGADVFMTSNRFTSEAEVEAWVLSDRFCPVANTGDGAARGQGARHGQIKWWAQSDMDMGPFQPINLIQLVKL